MSSPETVVPEPPSVVLLLHCPLRLGLAAQLTQFIYKNNGRGPYHDPYVDAEGPQYYTRPKWDVSQFSRTLDEMTADLGAIIGKEPDSEWSLHVSTIPIRLAVFVSKEPW